jgi:hypothetical protein
LSRNIIREKNENLDKRETMLPKLAGHSSWRLKDSCEFHRKPVCLWKYEPARDYLRDFHYTQITYCQIIVKWHSKIVHRSWGVAFMPELLKGGYE